MSRKIITAPTGQSGNVAYEALQSDFDIGDPIAYGATAEDAAENLRELLDE